MGSTPKCSSPHPPPASRPSNQRVHKHGRICATTSGLTLSKEGSRRRTSNTNASQYVTPVTYVENNACLCLARCFDMRHKLWTTAALRLRSCLVLSLVYLSLCLFPVISIPILSNKGVKCHPAKISALKPCC